MSDDVKTRPLVLDEAEEVRVFQVAGGTNATALARSIMEEVRAKGQVVPNVTLHAMGHSAVGQAIKAVPIVNGFLAPKGVQMVVLPSFGDVDVVDQETGEKVKRTITRLRLRPWMVGG